VNDSGKEFFHKLFEELVCNVIHKHPRSKTKTVMKRKGKAPLEEYVEKHVTKKITSKEKESQKMVQWMKMDSNELKWVI
jgi:hypothetical protein